MSWDTSSAVANIALKIARDFFHPRRASTTETAHNIIIKNLAVSLALRAINVSRSNFGVKVGQNPVTPFGSSKATFHQRDVDGQICHQEK
jgi:hypothetical protein